MRNWKLPITLARLKSHCRTKTERYSCMDKKLHITWHPYFSNLTVMRSPGKEAWECVHNPDKNVAQFASINLGSFVYFRSIGFACSKHACWGRVRTVKIGSLWRGTSWIGTHVSTHVNDTLNQRMTWTRRCINSNENTIKDKKNIQR